MATGRIERKLAAILAADVAGYSRLMGADEEGTLERLKALRRDLLDPNIAEHKGRIVKTTGDGVLVEFASVVDAVRCAVQVQQAMPERMQGPQCRRDRHDPIGLHRRPGPKLDRDFQLLSRVARETRSCLGIANLTPVTEPRPGLRSGRSAPGARSRTGV